MKWPLVINVDFAKGPNERQWVTVGIFILAFVLLGMAVHDRTVWDVDLFKIIVQAVIVSGIVGAILAFHVSANKSDETKANNTARAFEAVTAVANASGSASVVEPASGKEDDPVHTVQDGNS